MLLNTLLALHAGAYKQLSRKEINQQVQQVQHPLPLCDSLDD